MKAIVIAARQPILEPSRNPSEAGSAPPPTARWRIVTDQPLSTTPCDWRRSASLHILPAE
jgi:hypothetical protein